MEDESAATKEDADLGLESYGDNCINLSQKDDDLNSFYHVFLYTASFKVSPVTNLRISLQSLTPPAMLYHPKKPLMDKLFSFMTEKNVLHPERMLKNRKLKISFLTSILVSWLAFRLVSSHWK